MIGQWPPPPTTSALAELLDRYTICAVSLRLTPDNPDLQQEHNVLWWQLQDAWTLTPYGDRRGVRFSDWLAAKIRERPSGG